MGESVRKLERGRERDRGGKEREKMREKERRRERKGSLTIEVSPSTENGAIGEVEPKVRGQVTLGTLPSAEKTT